MRGEGASCLWDNCVARLATLTPYLYAILGRFHCLSWLSKLLIDNAKKVMSGTAHLPCGTGLRFGSGPSPRPPG